MHKTNAEIANNNLFLVDINITARNVGAINKNWRTPKIDLRGAFE